MFQTQSLAPAPLRPRRRRKPLPLPEYYWRVTVSQTQVGFAIHETQGDVRELRAVIVDEDEAWDYAERRAKKPWRILADRSE